MNIVKVEHLLKYVPCITLNYTVLPRIWAMVCQRLGPPPITVVAPGRASGIKRCSVMSERDFKLLVQERRRSVRLWKV